jgi:hypothetical protein
MKRLKIGFLALLAIATMSFTIAADSKVFAPAAKQLPNCYNITAGGAPNCMFMPPPVCNANLIGRPVGARFGTPACPNVGNVFCCAKLRVETKQECLNQPPLNFIDCFNVQRTQVKAEICGFRCKPD